MVYPVLFLPVTSVYSLLVGRTVDVNSLFRRELQYTLTRYALSLVVALPFVILATFLLLGRHQAIGRLFWGTSTSVLLVLGLAGLVAIRLRRHLLGTLKRRFYREPYDAQLILVKLVERNRGAHSIEELCDALRQEIDKALHLTDIRVFAIDRGSGLLVSSDRNCRPLSVTSPLARFIAGDTTPMRADDGAKHLLEQLPREDRRWIEDGGFKLLVPMLGLDGSLLGTIAVAEKKSALPFTDEDQLLLTAVSAMGGLAVEARLGEASHERSGIPVEAALGNGWITVDEDADPAAECRDCGRVEQPGSVSCTRCGGLLEPASVPYVLRDKFRFAERIGSGGMGVVYRAVDLTLGRTVAIKTLPAMSPASSHRLHREARVMAKVQHPNLAMIYGAETWRGIPMLVFEYMDGGTLLDRIRRAPFDPPEVVELGMTLLDVLERIHATGILHRDIKPSNIGFSMDDEMKLLDFGLAHIVIDSRRQESAGSADRRFAECLQEPGSDVGSSTAVTWTRSIIGTPAYLSPEALRGLPPEASFDLWSMSIVLYEALTGKNPVKGECVRETLARVVSADVPDIRAVRPELTEPVAHFFKIVLAKDRGHRPRTAMEVRAELERLASCVRDTKCSENECVGSGERIKK